jgi:hypothetical protein
MKRRSIVISMALAVLMVVGTLGISLAEEAAPHSHAGMSTMACCGDSEKVSCQTGQHDLNKVKVGQVLNSNGAPVRVTIPDPNDKPSCMELTQDLNKEKIVQVLTDKGSIARIVVPDPSQAGRCPHASNMLCKAATPQDPNKTKVGQVLNSNGAPVRVTVADQGQQGPCCTPAPQAVSDAQGHHHNL